MTRYVFRRHILETHAGRAGPRFEIRALTPPDDEPPAGHASSRAQREH